MFEKFKGFVQAVKARGAKLASSIGEIVNNEKAADGIMRWPRPVAFFLIVIMFVVGWFNTGGLLAFAQAISALPSDFWTIIYIVLGSIGASKLSNDVIKVITSRK